MYIKLTEEKIKQLQEITGVDYDAEGDLIPISSIEAIIDDLMSENQKISDKFIDYVNEVEENYTLKKIDAYEFYGVAESDF